MRRVIAGVFVSLDGVMQAPGGPAEDPTGGFALGGWIVPHMDEAAGVELESLFAAPFDLLLGRKTYEIFAAHWPHAESGPDGSVAVRFNRVTKYVATRSGAVDTGWKNTIVLRDAAADVAALRSEDGPNLLIQGSSDLIQTLLAHDLIDEVNAFTFPVVLGSGKRLFGEGARPARFRLVRHAVTPRGALVASYVREGALETGDFALETPTAAEAARRQRIGREG